VSALGPLHQRSASAAPRFFVHSPDGVNGPGSLSPGARAARGPELSCGVGRACSHLCRGPTKAFDALVVQIRHARHPRPKRRSTRLGRELTDAAAGARPWDGVVRSCRRAAAVWAVGYRVPERRPVLVAPRRSRTFVRTARSSGQRSRRCACLEHARGAIVTVQRAECGFRLPRQVFKSGAGGAMGPPPVFVGWRSTYRLANPAARLPPAYADVQRQIAGARVQAPSGSEPRGADGAVEDGCWAIRPVPQVDGPWMTPEAICAIALWRHRVLLESDHQPRSSTPTGVGPRALSLTDMPPWVVRPDGAAMKRGSGPGVSSSSYGRFAPASRAGAVVLSRTNTPGDPVAHEGAGARRRDRPSRGACEDRGRRKRFGVKPHARALSSGRPDLPLRRLAWERAAYRDASGAGLRVAPSPASPISGGFHWV